MGTPLGMAEAVERATMALEGLVAWRRRVPSTRAGCGWRSYSQPSCISRCAPKCKWRSYSQPSCISRCAPKCKWRSYSQPACISRCAPKCKTLSTHKCKYTALLTSLAVLILLALLTLPTLLTETKALHRLHLGAPLA